MNEFKVGDKVVRTGISVGRALQGRVYEISEVFPLLQDRLGINLEGHEPDDNIRFQYYSYGFELYDDALSPLEAAEALLNRQEMQVFDELDNKWYRFYCDLSDVTLEALKHIKLRLKPEKVVINGVTVLAPLTRKPNQEFIYFINFFKSRVYQLPTENLTFNHKYFWATKEDAQQVLDAMLIPFKD